MITVKNLVRLHHIIATNIEKMECKLGEITFKSNLSPQGIKALAVNLLIVRIIYVLGLLGVIFWCLGAFFTAKIIVHSFHRFLEYPAVITARNGMKGRFMVCNKGLIKNFRNNISKNSSLFKLNSF